MINAITKAGDIQIEALEIITATNKTIDIRAQLIELNIFEDLYTDVLSGTILIQDSFNFIINLPMVGEEQIHIKVRTPSLNNKQSIDRIFAIYKVSDKFLKDRSLIYQIHFISVEAIADANKAVSRAFSGRVSDLIQDVLRKPIFLGTEKTLAIEDTSNSVQFIPAFWSPFKTISYLTKRGMNNGNNPGFLFYETNKNFVFASTDSLLSQKPMFEYKYSETSARDGSGTDFEEAYKKILAFRSDTVFDYLDRLHSGMYASKISLINPINKSMEVVTNNYLKDFDKYKHLDKYPLASKIISGAQNSNLIFEEYVPLVYDTKDARSSQWKIQRRMIMAQLNAVKFEIEVNGRTDIEVGKVVSITMPAFTAINEGDRARETTDTYYNGNYLITAINHRIGPASHRMIMEIVKDTFGTKIPTT
jgi:hypothetical protein